MNLDDLIAKLVTRVANFEGYSLEIEDLPVAPPDPFKRSGSPFTNVVTSQRREKLIDAFGEDPPETRHALLLDIDVPAALIPSTTPGHSHLYVDLNCSEADLMDFLAAAEAIGLIEPGYRFFSQERGATVLRLPWVKKEGGDHHDE